MEKNKEILGQKVYKDFGESIGGAVKDSYTQLEVKKSTVWPSPDYKIMVKEGKSREYAFFVKYLRDRFPNVPYQYTPYSAEKYKYMFEKFKETTEQCTEVDPDIFMETYMNNLIEGTSNVPEEPTFYLTDSRYQKIFLRLQLTPEELDFIHKQVIIQNFPEEFSSIKKNLVFKEAEGDEKGFRLYDFRNNKTITVKDTNQEGIMEYINDVYVPKIEKQRSLQKELRDIYVTKPVRTLAEANRESKFDFREGKDVHGGSLIEAFKLRGGEFGNWVSNDERIEIVNKAYDGLGDLLLTMKADPSLIGLRFENLSGLAIAFGARGRSRALAHYEPKRKVINLTKLGGAGSLAHEFAHALDKTIAKTWDLKVPGIETDETKNVLESITDIRKLSKIINETPEQIKPRDNEVIQKAIQLMKTLREVEVTEEEKEQEIQDLVERFKEHHINANIMGTIEDRVISKIQHTMTVAEVQSLRDETIAYAKGDSDGFTEDLRDFIDTDRLKEFIDINKKNLEKSAREKAETHYNVYGRKTNFLNKSRAIDEVAMTRGYFQSPSEMFARAFESYIEDVITSKGETSDFLVWGTEGRPTLYNMTDEGELVLSIVNNSDIYPYGEERQRINKEIQEFIQLVLEVYGYEQTEEVIIEKLKLATDVPMEDYVDIVSRFKLTLFKEMCWKNAVNVEKTRTLKEGESLRIRFEEDYIGDMVILQRLDNSTLELQIAGQEPIIRNDVAKVFQYETGYIELAEEIAQRKAIIEKQREQEILEKTILCVTVIENREFNEVKKYGFNRGTVLYPETYTDNLTVNYRQRLLTVRVLEEDVTQKDNAYVAEQGLFFNKEDKIWEAKTPEQEDYTLNRDKEGKKSAVLEIDASNIFNATGLRREIVRHLTGEIHKDRTEAEELLFFETKLNEIANEDVYMNLVDLDPNKTIEEQKKKGWSIYKNRHGIDIDIYMDTELDDDKKIYDEYRRVKQAIADVSVLYLMSYKPTIKERLIEKSVAEKQRLAEGVSQLVTKRIGLDVRTYFTDKKLFENFWDNAESTKTEFIREVLSIYAEIEKVLF